MFANFSTRYENKTNVHLMRYNSQQQCNIQQNVFPHDCKAVKRTVARGHAQCAVGRVFTRHCFYSTKVAMLSCSVIPDLPHCRDRIIDLISAARNYSLRATEKLIKKIYAKSRARSCLLSALVRVSPAQWRQHTHCTSNTASQRRKKARVLFNGGTLRYLN